MIKITGKIKKKFETNTFGNGFDKRLFWLEEVTEKYLAIRTMEAGLQNA